MIKLTSLGGIPIYFSPEQIAVFHQYKHGGSVVYVAGLATEIFEVKETPEEILKQMPLRSCRSGRE